MRSLFFITLSVLLLANVARAQAPEQSWNNLRILRVGDKIQVMDQKLKSQKGTFLSVSEEALTFQKGKDTVTLQRPDVFRITSLKPSKRLQNALIGLGGGALIGVGLLAVMAGSNLAAPAVAAGVGALAGASTPSQNKTLYRAPATKWPSETAIKQSSASVTQ